MTGASPSVGPSDETPIEPSIEPPPIAEPAGAAPVPDPAPVELPMEPEDPPGEIVRSVDLPTPRDDSFLTVDTGTVRLVDPAPAQDQLVTDATPRPEPAVQQTSPWSLTSPAGDRVAFSFNLAKTPGQGEDCDPILHEARDLGLVAVFDGMGGAGGTVYSTNEGPRTGAYLASRAARDVVDRRMLALMAAAGAPPESTIATDLHDVIDSALRSRLTDLQAPRSMLRSKLLRALPTTMALAAVHRSEPDSDDWGCDVLWAGDSRIYLLQPGSGLSQLTKDDIRDEGDAMANLRQDSVINNAMSADTPFLVNHRRIRLGTPFLIIAATDGCFGYLPSPMHFEGLLLSTLRTAPDVDAWSTQLQTQISAIAGDDASMAVLGIGGDHLQFQSLFAERTLDLDTRWVTPLDQLDAAVGELERQLDSLRQQQSELTAQLWAAYQTGYERHLASESTEGSAS